MKLENLFISDKYKLGDGDYEKILSRWALRYNNKVDG